MYRAPETMGCSVERFDQEQSGMLQLFVFSYVGRQSSLVVLWTWALTVRHSTRPDSESNNQSCRRRAPGF